MVEILDLYNAIATKLHKLTGHPCYYDYVEQNAVYPCFFIRLVDSEQTPDLDRRYLREHNFEILFFPSESGEIQDINSEVYSLLPNLFMELEYIELNGILLRGTDMGYKVVDTIPQFLVSYDFFILKERDPEEKMQTLKTNGGIADGK